MPAAKSAKQSELPPLRMTVESGKLAPADPYTAERLDSFRSGTTMMVQPVVDSQSPKRKKYWAILARVVKDCPSPWHTVKEASNALKIALGVTDDGRTVGGGVIRYPASLNELQEPEFEEFYEGAMLLLHRITGVDPETLTKETQSPGSIEAEPGEGSDGGPSPSPSPDRPTAAVAKSPDRIAAKNLSDDDLASELERVGKRIDEGFGEGSGSPGEWWYERHEELTAEQKRRATAHHGSVPDLKREAVAKFLWFATDKDLTAEKKLIHLASVQSSWMAELPDEVAFVQTCSETTAKVIRGELKADEAKRYLLTLAAKG